MPPTDPPSESPLEPDLEICDAHHHLYQPGSPYHDGVYEVADLRRDIAGNNVRRSVFVETQAAYRTTGPPHLAPVGETEWVREQAQAGLVGGIVAFVDLMQQGDVVRAILDAHVDVARGLLRGVRFRDSRFVQPRVPADWIVSERLRANASILAAAGLTLDLKAFYDQLHEVATFARSVPEVTIVLGHLGAPVIPTRCRHPHRECTREEMLVTWRAGIRAVARCPNVVVKVGGIGSKEQTDPDRLARPLTSEVIADHWGDDLRFVIDEFGPDRAMLESNFPLDGYLCGYTTLWNVYKRATLAYSVEERRSLFHDTAARVYRLGQPA